MLSSTDKIALFIDGANLNAAARVLGWDIDFRRLLTEFERRGRLMRALYYTAVVEDQARPSIRPLIDWLDYNGYTAVTKPARELIDSSGHRRLKGNMRVELAVGAMELADHIDEMVLLSGDGSFRSLVEAIQRRGVRVTVISTLAGHPPMIADELRREVDSFIDLRDLQSRIGRDPAREFTPRES